MVTKTKEWLDNAVLLFYHPKPEHNQIPIKELEETNTYGLNFENIDYKPKFTDFEILGNSNIPSWLSNLRKR